jgi:hypothetical protein
MSPQFFRQAHTPRSTIGFVTRVRRLFSPWAPAEDLNGHPAPARSWDRYRKGLCQLPISRSFGRCAICSATVFAAACLPCFEEGILIRRDPEDFMIIDAQRRIASAHISLRVTAELRQKDVDLD